MTWIHSTEIELHQDPDEGQEPDLETCPACQQPIGTRAYWYCADNGEEIHDGCAFPDWG